MVITFTHSGGNVKVEDGGNGILHVVLEKLHYDIWVNVWAVDRNGHMRDASGLALFQHISHSYNEVGLPHSRSS